MIRLITGTVLILAILMVIPFQAYAATPKETVEVGVNKVIETLSDPAFKAKPKDQQIAIIGAEIDTIFDFKELSRRTLGKHWKKMSVEQQTEFVQLFKELLQGVYADRLLAYSDQKVIFDKEIILKKGRAEVQSYLQTSDGKKFRCFTASPTRAAAERFTISSSKGSAWSKTIGPSSGRLSPKIHRKNYCKYCGIK